MDECAHHRTFLQLLFFHVYFSRPRITGRKFHPPSKLAREPRPVPRTPFPPPLSSLLLLLLSPAAEQREQGRVNSNRARCAQTVEPLAFQSRIMTSVLKREPDEKSRIRISVCASMFSNVLSNDGFIYDGMKSGKGWKIELRRVEIAKPRETGLREVKLLGADGLEGRETKSRGRDGYYGPCPHVGPFLHPLMETSLLRYWVELADRTINSLTISFN